MVIKYFQLNLIKVLKHRISLFALVLTLIIQTLDGEVLIRADIQQLACTQIHTHTKKKINIIFSRPLIVCDYL